MQKLKTTNLACSKGNITSTELKSEGYLFYSTIPSDKLVHSYNGVQLKNGKMAYIEDNVAFEGHTNQVTTY